MQGFRAEILHESQKFPEKNVVLHRKFPEKNVVLCRKFPKKSVLLTLNALIFNKIT